RVLCIYAGATLSAGTILLYVQSNWINHGAFLAVGSSVTLVGISKSVQGPTTYNNLAVAGSYSLLNGITVNGTMNLSGTLLCGATTNIFSRDFFDTGTLSSSGTITFPGTSPQAILLNGGFSSSGTVNFNGSVAAVVGGGTAPLFHDVNINNTGGVTPTTDWTVSGEFVVGAGSNFTASAATYTFGGSFNNQGTVISGGTLNFTPSGAVIVTLRGTTFSSAGEVF